MESTQDFYVGLEDWVFILFTGEWNTDTKLNINKYCHNNDSKCLNGVEVIEEAGRQFVLKDNIAQVKK